MDNNSQNQGSRRIKPFWAITVVAVVALVLGGIIYFYTMGNELQDDIYSISFTSPVQIHKKPAAKLPAKTGTASTPKTTTAK